MYQFGLKLQDSIHFFLWKLPFQRLKSRTINFFLDHNVLKKRIIEIANALAGEIFENGTFRTFYAKLCILLSVIGSTNRRNEIILAGDYKR